MSIKNRLESLFERKSEGLQSRDYFLTNEEYVIHVEECLSNSLKFNKYFEKLINVGDDGNEMREFLRDYDS